MNIRTIVVLATLAAGSSLSGIAIADPLKAPHANLGELRQQLPAPMSSATLSPAGEGRRLFLELNCYSCHGMSAQGGMGPNIQHAESGDVSEALIEGEDSGMRSFSGYVTTTDINNITAYLQSIGTSSEPKFNDWWVPVPPK